VTRVDLTLEAERDLIDIYLFGATQFGAVQADRYAEDLSAKMTTLAENPSFGADYSFVQIGLRRGECASHAIYYRPTDAGILVLRILHGRRDAGRHLL
jgi:toxin ParE1/3/4